MQVITPIPSRVYLAISGGVDSMVIRHFLINGRRDVKYLFMHHNTPTSDIAHRFLSDLIPDLIVGRLVGERIGKESEEMYWRRERYAFFDNFTDRPIITGHHLDDQVENWVMSTARGNPQLIPYRRDNYLRPFLKCRKSQIEAYARKHSVTSVMDMSNLDVKYPRNRIRHRIIPELLQAYPGLYKTVSRLVDQGVRSQMELDGIDAPDPFATPHPSIPISTSDRSIHCQCGDKPVYFGASLMGSLNCPGCGQWLSGVGEEFIDTIENRWESGERGFINH